MKTDDYIQSLIERDIPKKPKIYKVENPDGSVTELYGCGHCDKLMAVGEFCNYCGGRIDWSEQ